MEIKSNQRIEMIDCIKALAIIMVVIAHCIEYGSGSIYLNNQEYFSNYIFKAITSFHMPLFMFISGFLLFKNNSTSIGKLFKKKTHSLLLPAIMWNLLFEGVTIVYKILREGVWTQYYIKFM